MEQGATQTAYGQLGTLALGVLSVALGLACVELLLYWWLRRQESRWFWPVSALLALLAGLAAGLLAAGVQFEGPWQIAASVGLGVFGLGALAKTLLRGRYAVPVMMLAPACLAVALVILYPFGFELRLAFSNLNLYTIGAWIRGGELGFTGLDNFIKVLTTSPLQTATFWELLGRTILWTVINITCHVGLGLGLALLLNRVRTGRPIYRTLLLLPWAMPQVVAVLAWRGEFHPQFGLINQLLKIFGIGGVNWWSDPIPVFASCLIVNIWLGVPFMMIVFLGGLQSIPRSIYEAAAIDGASRWTQFRRLTLPLLRPVVVPSVTLGTIWTFNNVNVIYLMTGQDGGNEYADILVSALYKSAFTYARYGFSAAFAMIIFALLIGFTLFWMRVSGGTRSVTQ